MDNFFNGNGTDKCTLGSEKILINRRNVVKEVKKGHSACKHFLTLALEARVVAATLTVLQITSVEDKPCERVLPEKLASATESEKREFIGKLAADVVDKFILKADNIDEYLKRKVAEDEAEEAKTCPKTNRYKCRDEQCNKTFAVNGKSKQNHELKVHGIQPIIHANTVLHNTTDDMYNYQSSLMEYLMLINNFQDAISEGDGERIIQCWKFFLPYLKADGASSRKYSLEGLHLLIQVYCTLSKRDAYRLMWNRSVKAKTGLGGNIPLDLALEHYIRIIKVLRRKLGPNQTNPHIMQRYVKALVVNKKLVDNFDNMSETLKASGKHVKKAAREDKMKIVKELMDEKAFTHTKNRRYTYYHQCKDSLLADFNIHEYYTWINNHKKQIAQRKTAR
jgi:hypothetical protein